MTNELSRAREMLDAGQLDRSAVWLDTVIRRSPKDADALLLRGLVAVAKPDADDAVEWLRRAVERRAQSLGRAVRRGDRVPATRSSRGCGASF